MQKMCNKLYFKYRDPRYFPKLVFDVGCETGESGAKKYSRMVKEDPFSENIQSVNLKSGSRLASHFGNSNSNNASPRHVTPSCLGDAIVKLRA